jgi:hypothetical protein
VEVHSFENGTEIQKTAWGLKLKMGLKEDGRGHPQKFTEQDLVLEPLLTTAILAQKLIASDLGGYDGFQFDREV